MEGARHTDPSFIVDALDTAALARLLPDSGAVAARCNQFRKELAAKPGVLFADVRFAMREENLVVLVVLVENIPFLPYPIVSYDQLIGWTYGAGLSLNNAGGRLESVGLTAYFGGERKLEYSYEKPPLGRFNGSKRFSVHNLYRPWRFEPDEFRQEELGARFATGRMLPFGVEVYAGTELARNIITDSTGAPHPTAAVSPTGYDVFLKPLAGLTYSSIVNRVFPTGGATAELELFTTVGVYGTEGRYIGMEATAASYYRLPLGAVLALGAGLSLQGGDVPRYETIYTGGVSSVRGYETGLVKGTGQALSRGELRKPLFTLWGMTPIAAAYADAGYPFNPGVPFGSGEPSLMYGYGGGLAVLAGTFGTVRADYSWNREGGRKLDLYTGWPF